MSFKAGQWTGWRSISLIYYPGLILKKVVGCRIAAGECKNLLSSRSIFKIMLNVLHMCNMFYLVSLVVDFWNFGLNIFYSWWKGLGAATCNWICFNGLQLSSSLVKGDYVFDRACMFDCKNHYSKRYAHIVIKCYWGVRCGKRKRFQVSGFRFYSLPSIEMLIGCVRE